VWAWSSMDDLAEWMGQNDLTTDRFRFCWGIILPPNHFAISYGIFAVNRGQQSILGGANVPDEDGFGRGPKASVAAGLRLLGDRGGFENGSRHRLGHFPGEFEWAHCRSG